MNISKLITSFSPPFSLDPFLCRSSFPCHVHMCLFRLFNRMQIFASGKFSTDFSILLNLWQVFFIKIRRLRFNLKGDQFKKAHKSNQVASSNQAGSKFNKIPTKISSFGLPTKYSMQYTCDSHGL